MQSTACRKRKSRPARHCGVLLRRGFGGSWRLDRFVVHTLISRHAAQWFIFVTRFRHRAFVVPDAIALGVLAPSNPIFGLLKLVLFFARDFAAKMRPRCAIVCFLLKNFEPGQCGFGTNRVVYESVNASKRRLLACRL